MKRIHALLTASAATAILLLAAATPDNAAAAGGWFDCCQCSTEGVSWCCKDCCFITRDCPDGSVDCYPGNCQET